MNKNRVGSFYFTINIQPGCATFTIPVYKDGIAVPVARVKGSVEEVAETSAQATRICETLAKGYNYIGYTHGMWWTRFNNPDFWDSLWSSDGHAKQ